MNGASASSSSLPVSPLHPFLPEQMAQNCLPSKCNLGGVKEKPQTIKDPRYSKVPLPARLSKGQLEGGTGGDDGGGGGGMGGGTGDSGSYRSIRDSFQGLVDIIDSRHETLVRRIEETVCNALLRNLETWNQAMASNLETWNQAMELTLESKMAHARDFHHMHPVMPMMGPLGESLDAQGAGGVGLFGGVMSGERHTPLTPAEEALKAAGDSNGKEASIMDTNNLGNINLNTQSTVQTTGMSKAMAPKVVQFWNIELNIVQAADIYASDVGVFGNKTSDPYIVVSVNDEREEIFRTHTVKKTTSPKWNQSVKFEVDPDKTEIIFDMYDNDALGKDDLIGRITLQAKYVQDAGGTVEDWFQFTPLDDIPHARGKLRLSATIKKTTATDETAYFRLQRWGSDVFHDESQVEHNERARLPCINILREITSSKKFDAFFCGFICLNALVMVIELEYHGRTAQEVILLAAPGTNQSEGMETFLLVTNVIFTVVFVIELLLRLAAWGYKFVCKMSSWLDIIIVAGSVLDLAGAGAGTNLTFLRLIRLVKLQKLLRAALMQPFCEPLRVLMKAIACSFSSLVWSFMLLAIIEIVAALFMTQVLADFITDDTKDLEIRRFVYEHYGTTSRTVLTMFQITMAPGAWGLVGRPVIEEVSPVYAWFFVLYVGGVSFAMIRVMTALFLRQTLTVAANDEQMMRNEKVKKKRKYSEEIRELFDARDAQGNGRLTFDQFKKFCTEQDGRTWLEVLDVTAKDAASIFQLVSDGDGRLTLDEFLSGVFRLKDTTKQIDMVVLQHQTKLIKKMIRILQTQFTGLSELCHLKLGDGDATFEDIGSPTGPLGAEAFWR